MSRIIQLSLILVLTFGVRAFALGDAATQPGTLAANGAETTLEPIGPMLTTAATPPLASSATQPAAGAATAPAVASSTTQPFEPYRSAIEKEPIRGALATGDSKSPATQTSPTQALSASWNQSGLGTAVQVGGALMMVIGLIFIGRALAKKFVPGVGASNGKNVIEILARYPLAKAQSLVMVRIGSQIVVLNQTRETSTSVLVISDQEEVANLMGQIHGEKPNSIKAGFTKLLANAQMDLERGEMPEQDAIEARMQANGVMEEEQLDEQLDEMAAAKRQLMELRQQVRSIRENLK